jgi:hypothetical protein
MLKRLLFAIPIAVLAACETTAPIRNEVRILGTSGGPNGLGVAVPTASSIQFQFEVFSGGDPVANPRVQWVSTVPSHAAVDSMGVVRTAATYAACDWVRSGQCSTQIIASYEGVADTVVVIVSPQIVMEAAPSSITVAVGDSAAFSFQAFVNDRELTCMMIVQPNPAYARLSNTNGVRYVHGVAAGSASILLEGTGDSLCTGASFSIPVNVIAEPLATQIKIIAEYQRPFGSSSEIYTDTTLALRAEVYAGTQLLPNARVQWSTENPAYATVDSTGLVRSAPTYASCDWVRIGYCVGHVAASYQGVSARWGLYIMPRRVWETQPTHITLAVGDSAAFSYKMTIDGVDVGCVGIDGVDTRFLSVTTSNGTKYVHAVAPGGLGAIPFRGSMSSPCGGFSGFLPVTVLTP